MSRVCTVAAVSLLAAIGFPASLVAQEMISDTTARKKPLSTWGAVRRA